MTHKQISSTQNPLIKQLVLLKDKSRERKKTNTFVIEGEREIELAIKGHYNIETLLFYPSIFDETKLNDFSDEIEIIEISKDVYQKLAHRDTTEGIIAISKNTFFYI